MNKIHAILISLLFFTNPALGQFHYRIPMAQPLTGQSDTVSIIFIGDVMMHSRQLDYDCNTFLENISGALSKADIAVANMEFPLGGKPYSGYPAFSTPDSYAEYVRDCGVDVFLTANNHVFDRGGKGLARTLGIYSQMEGVRYTGCAADKEDMQKVHPLILRCKGMSFAFINFSYGSNIAPAQEWPRMFGMDKAGLKAAIRLAKECGADFIIALPHWGTEYVLTHNKEQQELAEWLVDEGVDAIIGAHPHVVQDSCTINGTPVFYSIGNAVSNMSARNTRLELAVTLKFQRKDMEKTMLEAEERWMWCTLPGMLFPGYATIFVDEWEGRREQWLNTGDYDNMIETLSRVKKASRR